ncbi:hypothetical protein ACG3SL_02185 [Sphingomonas sp. CJ20]
MSPFELVFAVFALLLGLAVAEVLGGFARTLKLRRKVRIGWLTPLLGVLVVLDLMTLWLAAWEYRDLVAANYLTLVVMLALVGGYYLFATLVFPDDPAEWPDFDLWYDQHNELVLGGMLAINLLMFATSIVVAMNERLSAIVAASGAGQPQVEGVAALVSILSALLPIPLLVALIVVKSRRTNVALLATIIGLILAGAVAGAV